jgi:hypothetical protein
MAAYEASMLLDRLDKIVLHLDSPQLVEAVEIRLLVEVVVVLAEEVMAVRFGNLVAQESTGRVMLVVLVPAHLHTVLVAVVVQVQSVLMVLVHKVDLVVLV